MDFDYSPRQKEWMKRDRRLHGAARLPGGRDIRRADGRGDQEGQSLDRRSGRRGPEGQGEGAGPVEPVPAAQRARRGPHQPRICAARRNDGPRGLCVRGVQLLGARHGQYGSAGPLRQPASAGPMAEAAARRRNPLGLHHDGAGGRFVRCDEHRDPHRAQGRSLCDQRPQMVVVGRRRSALQDHDRDGQDRSRYRQIPPAIADPRADGYAGRQDRAHAAGVRLSTMRRTAMAKSLFEGREGAAREHDPGRGPRLRDRARPPRTRPHPSLHAHHRRRRARAGTDGASAFCRAKPSARRSPNIPCGNSASPTRAPISRCAVFCASRPPT